MNKKIYKAEKCCSDKIIEMVIILDDDSLHVSSLVQVKLKQSEE
jgi:hypothetical protein